jgi:hypothetical protein
MARKGYILTNFENPSIKTKMAWYPDFERTTGSKIIDILHGTRVHVCRMKPYFRAFRRLPPLAPQAPTNIISDSILHTGPTEILADHGKVFIDPQMGSHSRVVKIAQYHRA